MDAPPVDLTARVREIERETIRQKALVVDVVRAVLRADPATLPPGVAEARLKLIELGQAKESSHV